MKHEQEQNFVLLHERIRLIRLQTFFKNAAGNPFGLIVGGILSAVVLYAAGVSGGLLLAWLALLLATSGLIFFFERHVKRIGLSAENSEHLFRIRVLLGAVACLLYGATVAFLPDRATGTAYTFVFIITSSVVTVAYMGYATTFSYGLMVNALTLLPFTAFCVHSYIVAGDRFFLLMAMMAVVWQVIVIRKALLLSRSAIGEIASSERLHDETTERRSVVEALKVSEDQSNRLASMLRLMCDNVPDMIWAKDLESRYTFVNKAFCELLLKVENTEEPLGKTFDYFAQRERDLHPDDPEWHTLGRFSQDLDRHTLSRDEPTNYEDSGNIRGRLVYLDVHQARFVNAQGAVIGTVGCARDITERKASEAFVQHLAHHDVLTDLPNRILLTDRLRQALAQAQRDRGKLAVLFLDLDRLKPVNDTLGHEIGDLLLKEVASRLRKVLTRQADTVSRLGGDEFVILLQRVNNEQDAAAVAEKILYTISQPYTIVRHTISISASIGIAISPEHGNEVNLLLRNADAAMYSAKNAGRNAYRFFDESMTRV
jgi:diguanylate cyclase (GGDEF)-like protein